MRVAFCRPQAIFADFCIFLQDFLTQILTRNPVSSGTSPKLKVIAGDREAHIHPASQALPQGTHNHRVFIPDEILGRDTVITVNFVLSAYLIVGTLPEERKLVIEFGEQYRRNQDRVSMFFPLNWLSA